MKPNPQDMTRRNTQAANKRLIKLTDAVKELNRRVRELEKVIFEAKPRPVRK